MEFLSLSRRRSSARNVPIDEERGETDVFAGYLIRHLGVTPRLSFKARLCATLLICSKMILILMQIKPIFASFALNLVLKVRVFRSQKRPIFQHFKKMNFGNE